MTGTLRRRATLLTLLDAHLKELALAADEGLANARSAADGTAWSQEDEQRLRDFVLLLPDLLREIEVWSRDEDLPPELMRLHLFVLTQLHAATDFLPEARGGILGYLDDAYIVSGVYLRSLRERPGARDAEKVGQVEAGRAAVRALFAAGCRRMDEAIENVARGSHADFPWVISETAYGIRQMRRFERGEVKS
jgi:hypothetical protein